AFGATGGELARRDGGRDVVAPGPDDAEGDDDDGRRGEAGERTRAAGALRPARGLMAVAAHHVHDRLAGRRLGYGHGRRGLAQQLPQPLLLTVARLVLGRRLAPAHERGPLRLRGVTLEDAQEKGLE